MRITPDFSFETLKTADVSLNYYTQQNLVGETKITHDKTKFKPYLSTNPTLQRTLEELQHAEAIYTLR